MVASVFFVDGPGGSVCDVRSINHKKLPLTEAVAAAAAAAEPSFMTQSHIDDFLLVAVTSSSLKFFSLRTKNVPDKQLLRVVLPQRPVVEKPVPGQFPEKSF